jgi:mono/diheme cytochrome c family protein/uncharacterized membrane protein
MHKGRCSVKWPIGLVVFLAIASTLPSRGDEPKSAAPEPKQDLGAEVRAVFAAKCAACHGPDLAKPKGRFGYVLDLRKVASNPEMVVPSRPEESELWSLVSQGEMPPPDSPRGPLTEAEKEIIRAWIAAGAPDALSPAPAAQSVTAGPAPSSSAPADAPTMGRTLRWLGKLHLLLIHFPIALLVAAGIGELISVWRGSRVPSPTVRFCLTVAAVAVVPTVAFGWLHAAAGNGVGSPQLLTAHRWVGTMTGVWVIGTALWAERDARRGVRSRGVRVALVIGIVLVAATAHLGALMVHGSDFLDW